MAAVAVIIASMAVVVVFVLGKRKSLFQIPECLICTKKHDLIGFFYDTVCTHAVDPTTIISCMTVSVLFYRK